MLAVPCLHAVLRVKHGQLGVKHVVGVVWAVVVPVAGETEQLARAAVTDRVLAEGEAASSAVLLGFAPAGKGGGEG